MKRSGRIWGALAGCAAVAAISFGIYSLLEKPSGRDSVLQERDGFEKQKETAVPPEEEPSKSKAERLLEQMTLEEKVGQMFIVRCPQEDAVSKVSQYHIGGYILFARDFEGQSVSGVTETIASYQAEAKVPLLIGVDEEGGIVNRISLNPAFRAVPFHSPQSLYAEGGFDLIESDTKEKAELLASLGINVNFAPVADVSQDAGGYMYPRTFGQDAKQTAEYVRRVTAVMKKMKMGSVLKHFPGYGSNIDTHTGVAYDERPYRQFTEQDFLPFQAGIEAGADMVLVSHNIVSCMDAQYPASLSKKVHEILRSELHFEGVIVTDDLVMDAVKSYAGADEAAVQAVLAGNDLLCCTDFEVQIPAVVEAVINGKIDEERINASVLRILQMKEALGLLGSDE